MIYIEGLEQNGNVDKTLSALQISDEEASLPLFTILLGVLVLPILRRRRKSNE